SASISTFDRLSPSGVSHVFVRSRPTTTTRMPWVSVSATFSARPRQAVTSKNDVSASFHWPVASSLTRRLTATPNLTNAAPFGVYRSSRSEEHTSELQSQSNLVCRLLLEKKKNNKHQRSSR